MSTELYGNYLDSSFGSTGDVVSERGSSFDLHDGYKSNGKTCGTRYIHCTPEEHGKKLVRILENNLNIVNTVEQLSLYGLHFLQIQRSGG